MRVLFAGDLGSTGFGTVTADLGRAMLDIGEDVRFVSINPPSAMLDDSLAPRVIDAATMMPTFDGNGQFQGGEMVSIIGGLIDGTTPHKLVNGEPWGGWTVEAMILLGDYRAVEMMVSREFAAFSTVPWYHYVPIEGEGLPPRWGELWRHGTPVAMSEFGADQIAKVTGTRPPVIYHGVDGEVFHPVSAKRPITLASDGRPDLILRNKDECKQVWAGWWAVPVAKKWILRTDRHMPRKRYNSMLRALTPVLYRNPDTTMVIHCHAFDQGGDLDDAVSKIPGSRRLNQQTQAHPQVGYGLFGRGHAQVLISNATLPREALVSLYNAADLYVSTSAEGFGLTIAEAIACGVPAVALDYSAVPEVVGPAGVCVPRAYLVENEYDHFWAAVDEDEFAKRVEFLITHQSRREDLGKKGPAHVAANFRWSEAAAKFRDLLHARTIARQAA